jgi:hypothetical protein
MPRPSTPPRPSSPAKPPYSLALPRDAAYISGNRVTPYGPPPCPVSSDCRCTRRPAGTGESFAASPTNVQALAALDAWPAWPEGRLALVGPAGTGKSHLARDWAARAGAVVIKAAATGQAPLDLAALRGRPLLVEDADRRASPSQEGGDVVDDETLFHLINMAGVDGGCLLLTGRLAPVAWEAAVPDLRSRLNALTVARIEEPDDVVLEAVLRRGFEAAGIRPSADLYPYLMRGCRARPRRPWRRWRPWTRPRRPRGARSTGPWRWRCWISGRTRRTEGAAHTPSGPSGPPPPEGEELVGATRCSPFGGAVAERLRGCSPTPTQCLAPVTTLRHSVHSRPETLMPDADALTLPAAPSPAAPDPAGLRLDAELLGSPERFFNRETSWLAFNSGCWRRAPTPATRCWSGCGSCRSAPTTSTNSTWSAWPA